MFAFPTQVAAALCDRGANCCFGGPSPRFNTARCQGDYLAGGFQNSNEGTQYLDGGNVAFDPVSAQACLSQIAAIDCSTNQLTSANMKVLLPDCFGALHGTLGVGSPCRDSIECATGEFCDSVVEAGVPAKCQPLRAFGASCSDFGTAAMSLSQLQNAQSACSNRGSGDTNLVCEIYDRVTGNTNNAWLCQHADGEGGAPCQQAYDCLSRVCNDNSVCAQAIVFAPTGFCLKYTIADAGGD